MILGIGCLLNIYDISDEGLIETLPKALRTQALTDLTSSFGWLGLDWQVWFGRFGWLGLVW